MFFEKRYGLVCKLLVSYYDPEILLFSICPGDTPVPVSQAICTRMILAALSPGKTWKQTKYLLTGDWINELWESQNGTVHKINGLKLLATTCMQLGNKLLIAIIF